MKILVITPQYAPDFGPSAPIYTGLCEDLAKMGCEVTVVTAFPNYTGLGRSVPHGMKLIEEEQLNGVRILRTYIYAVPKSSLWKRLLYHASFNIFATLAALRTKKTDIIIADAPVLWSGLPLIIKALIPRTAYIYVVHDIYPDILVRLNMLHNPFIIHLIDRIERFYYQHALQISVL